MKKIFTLIVALAATVCGFAQSSSMNFIGNGDMDVVNTTGYGVTTVKDTLKVQNMSMTAFTADIVVPDLKYTMPGSSTVMTLASFTIPSATFTFANMTATFAEQDYSTTTVDASGKTKDVAGTFSGNYSAATGALTVDMTIKYGTMWSVMQMVISYKNTAYYTVDNAWNLVGRGTAANPYKIYDASDFAAMAQNCTASNTGAGEYFKVMNNIDFGGTESAPVQLPAIAKAGITSITSVAYGFDGTFDGDNKTISGIYHTNCGSDANGKFNAIFSSLGENGTVKNVYIGTDNYIKSYNYVAPIVCISKGTIEGCTNNAPVIAANFGAAGICGYMCSNKGTIKNCTNTGDIQAMTYAAGICAGSQSGTALGATDASYNYLIDNCTNSGNISTTNGTGSAGIAGSYSGSITNCSNTGNIDDSNGTSKTIQYTAGIVSCMSYVNNVSGNTNYGDVKGVNYVGGVIGCIMKTSDEAFDVSNNANSGKVTATGTPSGDILGGSKLTQQTPTAILSVNADTTAPATKAMKKVINGRLVIVNGDKQYSISGAQM